MNNTFIKAIFIVITCITASHKLSANNTTSQEQKTLAYHINWENYKKNWNQLDYKNNLKIGTGQILFGLSGGLGLGCQKTYNHLFTEKNILKPKVFIPIALGLVCIYKAFQALWHKDISFLWFRLFYTRMLPGDIKQIINNAKDSTTKDHFKKLQTLNTTNNKTLLKYAQDHDALQIVQYMQKQKDFIDKYNELMGTKKTIEDSFAQNKFAQKEFEEKDVTNYIQFLATDLVNRAQKLDKNKKDQLESETINNLLTLIKNNKTKKMLENQAKILELLNKKTDKNKDENEKE